MSQVTGLALVDNVLTSFTITLNNLVKNAYAAKVQQMLNAGQDTNFALALALMNNPDVRGAANDVGTLAGRVGQAKTDIADGGGGGTGDNYRLVYAQDGQTEQSLQGQSGVKDVFIFNHRYDANGSFADFGQVTLSGYNRAEGDLIVFVDQSNTANITISDFSNYVQPQAGNARIEFNTNPDGNHALQWLQIMGAQTSGNPFGLTVSDITNVDFVNITQQQVDTVGIVDILSL